MQGRLPEAIEECHRAIAIDPDFGNPYNDIGAYLIELNKPDEAISWLEKAIASKRYACYFYPHYNLGRVWETKGKWIKAMEEYQKALKLKPEYDLAYRSYLGIQARMN
jgi:Tfp pilus assembly protein PilF